MVFSRASTQVACNTSTGTQNITVSGSTTPSLVVIEVSSGTVDGTNKDGMRIGGGFSDGTNSRAFSIFSEDNVLTTDCGGRQSATQILEITSAGSTVNDGRAAFSAWINSGGSVGVQINWTTAPSAAYLLNVTFYFGATEAKVTTLTTSATLNGTASVTGMSNQPNYCHAVFTDKTTAGFQGINHSWGYAVDNNGTTQQGCKGIYEEHGQAGALVAGIIRNDRIAAMTTTIGGLSQGTEVELTSWNSDGATFTTRAIGASLVGLVILVVIPDDQPRWLGVINEDQDGNGITGSVGTYSIEFPTFQPTCIDCIASGQPAVNTWVSTAAGPWVGVAHASGQSDQAITVCQIESGATPSDTHGLHETGLIAKTLLGTGAAQYEVGLNSFDTHGFNIETQNATATGADVYMLFVAVGIQLAELVQTETVAVADAQILDPTLNFTEAVTVADDQILQPTLNVTESVDIADEAILSTDLIVTEPVDIADDAVLSAQDTQLELLADENVAVADDQVLSLQDQQLELVADEPVSVSDTQILSIDLVLTEDVFVQDRARLFGSVAFDVTESVDITDDTLMYTGAVLVASEAVSISDAHSFGDGLVSTQASGGARQIAQGGALSGFTEAGGSIKGRTS